MQVGSNSEPGSVTSRMSSTSCQSDMVPDDLAAVSEADTIRIAIQECIDAEEELQTTTQMVEGFFAASLGSWPPPLGQEARRQGQLSFTSPLILHNSHSRLSPLLEGETPPAISATGDEQLQWPTPISSPKELQGHPCQAKQQAPWQQAQPQFDVVEVAHSLTSDMQEMSSQVSLSNHQDWLVEREQLKQELLRLQGRKKELMNQMHADKMMHGLMQQEMLEKDILRDRNVAVQQDAMRRLLMDAKKIQEALVTAKKELQRGQEMLEAERLTRGRVELELQAEREKQEENAKVLQRPEYILEDLRAKLAAASQVYQRAEEENAVLSEVLGKEREQWNGEKAVLEELLEACEIERNSMVEQLLSQKKVQADLIERMDALAHKVEILSSSNGGPASMPQTVGTENIVKHYNILLQENTLMKAKLETMQQGRRVEIQAAVQERDAVHLATIQRLQHRLSEELQANHMLLEYVQLSQVQKRALASPGATPTPTRPHSPPPPLHHTLSSERPVDVASFYSSGGGTNIVTSITSGGGEAQTMHRPATDLQQAMHRPATDLQQAMHRPATDLQQATHRPATPDWKCQEWELARPGKTVLS